MVKVEFNDRSESQYDPKRLRGVAVYRKIRTELLARGPGSADRTQSVRWPREIVSWAALTGSTHLAIDAPSRMDSGRTAAVKLGPMSACTRSWVRGTSHSAAPGQYRGPGDGARREQPVVGVGEPAFRIRRSGSRMQEGWTFIPITRRSLRHRSTGISTSATVGRSG
jgi:hypothetical protein